MNLELERSNLDVRQLGSNWPLYRKFNLDESSLVVVAGAYQGIVMQLLADAYAPNMIMGYEPQVWAATKARERLAAYDNCRVVGYGLGIAEGVFDMGEYFTDACSFVNVGEGSREHGAGFMKDAAERLKIIATVSKLYPERSDDIDLFVMNMEGYEFELLPYLLETGILANHVRKLAVQWHHGFGNDNNYEELLERLDNIYTRVVDEAPSWIYWERQ
jgi:hypothetical protein